MRFRVCAIGAAALFWQVGVFAAPPAGGTDPATAREQLKIGYQLAQDNKCAEAIPHLAESLKLDPRAITLINLADCEEKTGKLADAAVHWADARARAQAEGQKQIEDEAAARAGSLDAKIPRLTINLAKTAPPDAIVERDGVALGAPSLGVALPMDPGAHAITVKSKGHADAKQDVTLKEGDKQTIEVDAGPVSGPATPPPVGPPVEEKKSGMSPLVPIGFGVGLAGLAVGTITGIMALGKGSDADSACPELDGKRRCNSKDALDSAESGKTLGTVSTIGFIVGGVGVGVGIVGLIIGGSKSEKVELAAKAKKLDFAVGPSSFLLKGTF